MRHRRSQLLNVTMAQIDVELCEVEKNLCKVIDIIDANRDFSDLIVFPELTLSGYSVEERYADAALRLDDPLFSELIASTRGVRVAVGFIEETKAFNYFNSLAIIDDGRLISVHRKIYPPNYGKFNERKYFASGMSHECVEVCGATVAPFICADAWNPGLVHLGAMDGAHVFLFSVCSPMNGLGAKLCNREGWKRLNRFYATIYGAYVIFVNRVGSEGPLQFWGESELIDPSGNAVTSSSVDQPCILTGLIDLSVVREARQILPSMRDDSVDFMRRQLSRMDENNKRNAQITYPN